MGQMFSNFLQKKKKQQQQQQQPILVAHPCMTVLKCECPPLRFQFPITCTGLTAKSALENIQGEHLEAKSQKVVDRRTPGPCIHKWIWCSYKKTGTGKSVVFSNSQCTRIKGCQNSKILINGMFFNPWNCNAYMFSSNAPCRDWNKRYTSQHNALLTCLG